MGLTSSRLIFSVISQHRPDYSCVLVSYRHCRFIKPSPFFQLINPLMQTSIIVIRGNPDDSAGTMNKKSPQMLVAFFRHIHQNAPWRPRPMGRGGKGCKTTWRLFVWPSSTPFTLLRVFCEAMKRAYKYRFYPTPDQVKLLAQTFGCVRFVYNSILLWRTDAYYEHQEKIGYTQASARLRILAQCEHPFSAFFKIVVASCNKITLCSLFFRVKVNCRNIVPVA